MAAVLEIAASVALRAYNDGMSDSAETVAREFVSAINRQDVEGLAGLMTEGHRFVDSLGNAVEGREKMQAAWAAYFLMVPDYSIAVEETYCGGPSTPVAAAASAQEIVVMLGVAQGTYSPDGQLKAENRWKTPAAWRALVEDGKVAEWRVYADNEPMRRLMAKKG
jgi:limonene-1,2-epoxide hydrolase